VVLLRCWPPEVGLHLGDSRRFVLIPLSVSGDGSMRRQPGAHNHLSVRRPARSWPASLPAMDGGTGAGPAGLPSDPAFVRAVMAHDGGDARKVREVTIGFAAVSALLTRRVAAVPAFWNAEGGALRRRGREVREFRIDDYGAPPYPEVVLMTARSTLRRHRDRGHGLQRHVATW
jgi:hypothetical protein